MSEQITPRVIPTAYGKYLAVTRESDADAPKVGYVGETEDEAVEKWQKGVATRLKYRRLAVDAAALTPGDPDA